MGQIVFQATLGGQVAVAGPNTASSFTLTLPAATDTLVGKATTDTLTNKTLTSPTITGATLTTSAFNGTVGATTASTGAFTSVTTTSITNSGLTSGRVTFAGASGLLSDSSKLTFDTSNLTVGVIGLSANADGATGKLVLRKPNEASGNGQITRMLDFAPYYPGFDEAVVKASIFSGVDTGTQNGQLGFMTATGGVLSEKMRLLANGNVGIGTSSPSGKLQIDSTNVDPSATATGITLINSTSSQAINNGGSISLGGVYTGSSITQFGYILGAKANSTDGNYAGYLSFGTRPNGDVSQERMRIDSSGNVGIGTSSPNNNLEVYSTSNPSIALTSTSASLYCYYGMTAGTVGGELFTFGQSYSAVYPAGVTALANNNYGIILNASNASGILRFQTNATERMRIDSSGNLLVGTTSSIAKFVVDGTVYFSTTTGIASTRTTGKLNIDANINSENGIDIQSLQSPANGSFIIFRNSSGAVAGSITHISSTAVLYNTTSDQRVKTNIIDAPSGNIDSIKVRSFDWIEDGSHQEYGMVAQELLEVAPYAVHQPQNSDEMMGVDYSKLVPMMIKEIQDLKQRIITLENK